MKKFFGEFKKFISKGNIFDLAVAVVLGNAFNKIVNTLVSAIIMPVIGWMTGGASVADWKWVIKEATETTAENAIAYGAFLQTIIDFLIIAMCLFLAVKVINASKARIEKFNNVLLKKLSELNKWDKKRLKKQGVDLARLEALGKDGKVCDLIKELEPEKVPPIPMPSNEEILLTEIRDLLKGERVEPQEVEAPKAKKEKTKKANAK